MTCSEQLLNSSFCEKDYNDTECDAFVSSEHVNLLSEFVEKKILPKISRGKFLDIGPGPGFITHRLSKYFSSTTIVEPNNASISLYRESNYVIHRNKFEDTRLDGNFDFILCSHMIYHVERNDYEAVIKRIYDLLDCGGKAMIVLVAPRGIFHNLCLSINNKYTNSSSVIKILEKLKIHFEVENVNCLYKANRFARLFKITNLFAISDCFTKSQYDELKTIEKAIIKNKITSFVSGCGKKNGYYEYLSEEDYLIISKP
jgi:SAM-dependent methyltransferase